jgi:hypothetical protein
MVLAGVVGFLTGTFPLKTRRFKLVPELVFDYINCVLATTTEGKLMVAFYKDPLPD